MPASYSAHDRKRSEVRISPMAARRSSPSSSASGGNRAQRMNVSRACVNCRQRKKKCDGVAPSCGTCVLYRDECVWNDKKDWRKNTSRAEVNGLRGRIAELEAALREARGQSMHSMQSSNTEMEIGMPNVEVEAVGDNQLRSLWDSEPGPSAPRQQYQPVYEGEVSLDPLRRWSTTSVPPIGGTNGDTGKSPIVRAFEPAAIPIPPPAQPQRSYDAFDEDLDPNLVQDDRGRLRVHHPTSAYRRDTAAEPTTVTSPAAATSSRVFESGTNDPDRLFARFLPDFFISRTQHDIAIDRFFRYFACWGQRATPHLFYRDMEIALRTGKESDLPLMAPNYSPLLHNIILAIGLAFSDDEHLRVLSSRRKFAAEGEKHIDRECSHPCVATVQALAIRASFASTMGDYSLGWVHHGLANRLCYAMGLHVNTQPLVARGKLNHEDAVQRNVTFWSCFCQEGMWGHYIGRKPQIEDFSLPPPSSDTATDQTQWRWPPGPLESLPPQPSYLSLAMVYTSKLFIIANGITREIYGTSKSKSLIEPAVVQRYSDALSNWLDELPPPLRVNPNSNSPVLPHILMIHLGQAWITILLYQPFSQVVSNAGMQGLPGQYHHTGSISMTRCHDAALRILQLTTLWHEQHTLRFTPPTMTAIVYCAGTSFVLAAAQASSPTQSSISLQNVHACLNFLEETGRTWEAGHQQASILQGLLSEVIRAGCEEPPSDSLPPPSESWSVDENFDQFIASLLSQSTAPIAATAQQQAVDWGLDQFL